jgi:hypothetical protein
VDPIASTYPELTPYQFASNRPIDGVDMDGLEFFKKTSYNYHWENNKPVLKAPTFLIGLNNTANNTLATIWNGTLGGLLGFSQSAGNYIFIDGRKAGTRSPINQTIDETFDALHEMSNTPIKTQVKGLGAAFTNWSNYEVIPQLFLFHELSIPVENTKMPSVDLPVTDVIPEATPLKVNRITQLPEALRTRPKWRQSTIDYLNANSLKDAKGHFLDAKTQKPISGKKHIGHLYESWREYQDNPANWNKTRQQVVNDYNDVTNLGYENGPTNSSNGAKTKGLENKQK